MVSLKGPSGIRVSVSSRKPMRWCLKNMEVTQGTRQAFTYNVILGQVKATDGIYQKAAVLLRKLSTRPCIYADGNHRLALVTVETFLRKNGLRIWTKDSLEICRLIKGIMQHNIGEIAEWLRNGPKESSSNKDSGICDGKKV